MATNRPSSGNVWIWILKVLILLSLSGGVWVLLQSLLGG
jgi:hypothetical protein